MDLSRQVVITGLGVVSPLGIGRETFWQALRESKSGVVRVPTYADSEMPVDFGAPLQNFDPKQYVKPRKALKVMCREIQTAFSASALASEDAKLEQADTPPERKGAVFGSQMLYGDVFEYEDLFRECIEDGEFTYDKFGTSFPNRMYPLWMLKNLPNMAACHIAIAQDAQGPNNTILLGEVSSLLAVDEAASAIRRNAADVMIVGGTGTRLELTGWIYRGALNMSRRSDDPSAACRPFDRDRDGIVNGEGAGSLILESREHAEQRGAPILATVYGIGSSFAPHGQDLSAAIQRSILAALRTAHVEATDIGHVNAHGISTILGDRAEAQAIRDTLGDVPVTASKSQFGHLGAGSGAVELIATVLSLQNSCVPPTLNFEHPDPRCPVNVIHGQPLTEVKPFALKLSHSQTGQTVAMVVKAEQA